KATIRLKWPNDLYDQKGAKLGGILCEGVAQATSGSGFIVAGIGINCLTLPRPETVSDRMVSATGTDPEALREQILQEAQTVFGPINGYEDDDIFSAQLLPEIRSRQYYQPGAVVTWQGGAHPGSGEVLEIEDHTGILVVRLQSNGEVHRLMSEEISGLREC
ncbi:MAG: hypothetical protein AAB425_05910, partial [Bdellovibrionota bacterium]